MLALRGLLVCATRKSAYNQSSIHALPPYQCLGIHGFNQRLYSTTAFTIEKNLPLSGRI